MKVFVRVIQFLVGLLFVISGLVKANDPKGLDYKMQEFFELWNGSLREGHFFASGFLTSLFSFLHDHALLLAIIMIVLEIVTGVALLIGWKKRPILYLLLVLMLFFTFLTGYAYLSGKFTNCGCFGDCLPITPKTSFIKDLVLTACILFLIFTQKYLYTLGGVTSRKVIVASTLVLSILVQLYVLYYLPFVDCLPFKKGNLISDQMKAPLGSLSDSVVIRFIYEKNGKRYEFAPESLPADFETYTFIDRKDKVVRKGNADPKLKGFSLTAPNGQDLTQMILAYPDVVLVFSQEPADAKAWLKDLRELASRAQQHQVPLYIVTSAQEQFENFLNKNQLNIPVFSCDFTAMRTAARTEPTTYVLKSGRIVGKYSAMSMDKVLH